MIRRASARFAREGLDPLFSVVRATTRNTATETSPPIAEKLQEGTRCFARRRRSLVPPALMALTTLSALSVMAPRGALAEPTFLRGDVDSSGTISVTDAARIIHHLLVPAPPRQWVTCEDAADVDDSGDVAISDVVYLLNALFRGGPAPPIPFPECGSDPTVDGLECTTHELCYPTFYGILLEGDSFFYLVDRSSGMQDSGWLALSKAEIVRNLGQFPEGVHFGIIFYDRGILAFPSDGVPTEADAASRDSATSFVTGMTGGNGACIEEALLAAVELAKRSPQERKVLFYAGRGRGICEGQEDEETYLKEALDAATTANNGEVRIHTIGLHDVHGIREEFLQKLAQKNGGEYRRM